MPRPMLPKRIAGIKLPKPLRHSGGLMLELACHPIALELAATAVIAAAAALASDEKIKEAAERARKDRGPGHRLAARAGEALAAAVSRRYGRGAPEPSAAAKPRDAAPLAH